METNWVELVLLKYDRGERLGAGECFAFIPPPALGGEIDANAAIVSNHAAMTIAMGQLFQQLG